MIVDLIECSVDDCDWKHLRSTQPPPPDTLASVFGPGVVRAAAITSALHDAERALRAHMDTHAPEDFLRTITRLRRELAAQPVAASSAADGSKLQDARMTSPDPAAARAAAGGTWRMDEPGGGGVEGFDPERDDADLHYVEWDSTDGNLRLWVGQHGGVDECAVTVSARDVDDLTLHCSRDQLTFWHRNLAVMLADAAAAADTASSRTSGGTSDG